MGGGGSFTWEAPIHYRLRNRREAGLFSDLLVRASGCVSAFTFRFGFFRGPRGPHFFVFQPRLSTWCVCPHVCASNPFYVGPCVISILPAEWILVLLRHSG